MIGVDIISIERMRRFVARFGERGLERFLSQDEIGLCYGGGLNISRVAGFWAAKEACSKALGVGIGVELGFHDMVIAKTERNAPILRLSQEKMRAFAIQELALSISHDGGFAIAVVMCSPCNNALV